MKNRVILICILAALVAITWWFLYGDRFDVSAQLSLIERHMEDAVARQADGRVNAPPPLRAEDESEEARLTRQGVLAWTNAHRKEHGAGALTPNEALAAAAETKMKDIFEKQYFEHESPDGIDPGTLAGQAGYLYILVGENLALGNFKDDQALVQAWMDSPGHRANILEAKYTEIGIAVGRGVFKGKETWVAVQEFGRPQSACPKPDADLSAQIVAHKADLDLLETEASALKADIEHSGRPRTREETDAYNQKVDRYNALAERINTLIKQIQGEIAVYNGGVEAYNACASTS